MTINSLIPIRRQIERMRELARSPELFVCDESVSAWCPAEHLDHLAKVSLSITKRLADPDVPPLPHGINPIGRMVLLLGWIPRGRGKTPVRLAGTRASASDIENALQRFEQDFEALPFDALRVSRAAVVAHPKFGGLTPSQSLRFLEVHNEHHLKIVRDIFAMQRTRARKA